MAGRTRRHLAGAAAHVVDAWFAGLRAVRRLTAVPSRRRTVELLGGPFDHQTRCVRGRPDVVLAVTTLRHGRPTPAAFYSRTVDGTYRHRPDATTKLSQIGRDALRLRAEAGHPAD